MDSSVVNRLNLHPSFIIYEQRFHLSGHPKPLLNRTISLALFASSSSCAYSLLPKQTHKYSKNVLHISKLFYIAVEISLNSKDTNISNGFHLTCHFLKMFSSWDNTYWCCVQIRNLHIHKMKEIRCHWCAIVGLLKL